MRASATALSLSLAAALWVAAAPAKALGFGRIGNTTQLGQTLNFAAAIRLDNDETLSRECVAAEVLVGDNKLQPGQVRVTLEAAAAPNERLVRVTTSAIVDEPVVTVSVSVGCTSKITRRFVAFIDPPLINAPQTNADNSMMVPQRADSQVAPLVAVVEGEKAPVAVPSRAPARPPRPERARREDAAPRAAPRSRPTVIARAADGVASEAAPQKPAAARKPAPRARAAQAPRPAASGPRLELEASPPLVARAASAPPAIDLPVVAAAAASAASAPAVDDTAALLALERERIRLLEEGLARLRSDSQATQQALVTLQARLQAAESERYANPLVYSLAWLSALLALAVGALWWRQSRARGAAQWWAPPAPVAAPRVERSKPAEFETAPATTMSGVAPAYEVSVLDSGEFSMPTPDLPMTVPAAAALRPPAPVPAPAPAEPARELSVEELIDLEQQAEFFVVLGQDEAAIELLMSHVRNDGGISPLPYLKLLEIYKRRGDADAYERIRDRFNRRFNAYAPDWSSDLQQGQALEAYPETVQRLQELWASPAKAMETLAAALFRRGPADLTYDLPAYRELLFLYAIARDFEEHGVADLGREVDLLLPMHDDAPPAPIAHLVSSGNTGFQNSALMTQPLDLDVSMMRIEDEGDGAAPRPPASTGLERRSNERAANAASNLIDFDLDLNLDPQPPVPPGSR